MRVEIEDGSSMPEPETYRAIIEAESQMVLQGAKKYGDFFKNAVELINLLEHFAKRMVKEERFLAVAFFSQVKKHLMLALFSATRRHHIQAGMDLRQVLEAASWMVYAMAHPEEKNFCEKDGAGNMDVPKRLKKQKYEWLEREYKVKSDEIKGLKERINESVGHSSVIYAFQNFKLLVTPEKQGYYTSFFDFEDEYKEKTNLWLVANTAMGLLDLIYGVNQREGVFEMTDDFLSKFKVLKEQNDALKEEMMRHERYLATQKREGGTSK